MIGQSAIKSGMAVYYRFEGNSNDSTVNGRNGADTSVSYGLSRGKFGQGVELTGTTSKIVLPSGLITSDLALATTGTIAFWFKLNTVSNAATTLLLIGDDAVGATWFRINADWRTGITGFDIILRKDNVYQWELYTALGTLPNYTSGWHHMAITLNTSPVLYIDGVATGVINIIANGNQWFKAIITDATTKAATGQLGKGSFNSALGYIDEFIIEKTKAWSAHDVRMYYQTALAKNGY